MYEKGKHRLDQEFDCLYVIRSIRQLKLLMKTFLESHQILLFEIQKKRSINKKLDPLYSKTKKAEKERESESYSALIKKVVEKNLGNIDAKLFKELGFEHIFQDIKQLQDKKKKDANIINSARFRAEYPLVSKSSSEKSLRSWRQLNEDFERKKKKMEPHLSRLKSSAFLKDSTRKVLLQRDSDLKSADPIDFEKISPRMVSFEEKSNYECKDHCKDRSMTEGKYTFGNVDSTEFYNAQQFHISQVNGHGVEEVVEVVNFSFLEGLDRYRHTINDH